MSEHLEKLVSEWRDAQRAIDLQVAERLPVFGEDRCRAVERLVAAHNALKKYAEEEMG